MLSTVVLGNCDAPRRNTTAWDTCRFSADCSKRFKHFAVVANHRASTVKKVFPSRIRLINDHVSASAQKPNRKKHRGRAQKYLTFHKFSRVSPALRSAKPGP